MVSRQQFLNKLHEKNYRYKDTQKRTFMYRKVGGTHRVFVPMRDILDDGWVMSTLAQMGCDKEEIETFIRCCEN